MFVDGLRTLTCPPEGTLPLNTASLVDGYHELRVVAVEAGPIRSQGRQILPIMTANYGRTIAASFASPSPPSPPSPPSRLTVGLKQRISITAKAPDCTVIAVFQGNRLVGKITGSQGRVEIDAASLGSGPVRLRVMGLSQVPRNNVVARPLDVEVVTDPESVTA